MRPAVAPGTASSTSLNQHAWIVCGLLASLAKLALALTTFGTNDVATWHRFADFIHLHSVLFLYRTDPMFNHPPFMTRVLPVLGWLSNHSPFGFPFWIRLPGILADFGSLGLMSLIIQPKQRLLILLAICPISILVSGFHGNTDPLMIFLILLSIYFLERRKWLYAAAVALGLAGCIKIAAIVLAPAFLFYLETFRRRAIFALAASVTFVLLSAPYLLQDPGIVFHNVFGYRSIEGIWGLPRLARALEVITRHPGYVAEVAGIERVMTAVLITGTMLLLSRRTVSLYGRCAISMFLFLCLTPGFGVQYLAWIVPFALFFGEAWTIAVYASSGLFLFLVYNYWSQAFPWYYADSLKLGGWPPRLIPFELIAWLVIGLALLAGLRRTQLTLSQSAINVEFE